ncbi:unnamed protein product [Amoebophrya sp. A25]|nr:unnamed protein product [Amoebophrya sp. A25]|eukprot:GSA25T00022235001.1
MVNNRKFRALVLAGSLAEAERVSAMQAEADGAAPRPQKLRRSKGLGNQRPIQSSREDVIDVANAFLEVEKRVGHQHTKRILAETAPEPFNAEAKARVERLYGHDLTANHVKVNTALEATQTIIANARAYYNAFEVARDEFEALWQEKRENEKAKLKPILEKILTSGRQQQQAVLVEVDRLVNEFVEGVWKHSQEVKDPDQPAQEEDIVQVTQRILEKRLQTKEEVKVALATTQTNIAHARNLYDAIVGEKFRAIAQGTQGEETATQVDIAYAGRLYHAIKVGWEMIESLSQQTRNEETLKLKEALSDETITPDELSAGDVDSMAVEFVDRVWNKQSQDRQKPAQPAQDLVQVMMQNHLELDGWAFLTNDQKAALSNFYKKGGEDELHKCGLLEPSMTAADTSSQLLDLDHQFARNWRAAVEDAIKFNMLRPKICNQDADTEGEKLYTAMCELPRLRINPFAASCAGLKSTRGIFQYSRHKVIEERDTRVSLNKFGFCWSAQMNGEGLSPVVRASWHDDGPAIFRRRDRFGEFLDGHRLLFDRDNVDAILLDALGRTLAADQSLKAEAAAAMVQRALSTLRASVNFCGLLSGFVPPDFNGSPSSEEDDKRRVLQKLWTDYDGGEHFQTDAAVEEWRTRRAKINKDSP